MKRVIVTALFFINITLLAQNTADLFIENPTVNGTRTKFSWEVHLTPTNTWSFPQSLGDCSWYFSYNPSGLENPVLKFIAPTLSTAVYSNSIGINGGKVQITTDITITPPDFGTTLTTGTKSHLYTVEMDITNTSVNSLVEWDQVNTGIFNGLDALVVESYNKSGNVPLPVELSSFTASINQNTVTLSWITQTELNNYGFEVERASSMTSPIQGWEKIGFVAGNGNSNSPQNYSFIDFSPSGGSKFIYRLKQIDNNGKFEYSDEVEIDLAPSEFVLYQNYPNPFNPSTKIQYALSSQQYTTLKVYDVLGNEMQTLVDEVKPAGLYEVTVDAANLPSGIYFYKLRVGSLVETKKMTLLR